MTIPALNCRVCSTPLQGRPRTFFYQLKDDSWRGPFCAKCNERHAMQLRQLDGEDTGAPTVAQIMGDEGPAPAGMTEAGWMPPTPKAH